MLPIRKVVLYKHGVGYFERQGEVEGDTSVDLHFKAPEMNDVLKSLTVIDFSGGIVSSISYESTEPLERRLEEIAIKLPEKNSLTGLISQVKGARVSVVVGSEEVEGLVTGIETITKKDGDVALTCPHLNLLVDGDTIRTFDVLELKQLTFLDDSLRRDLQHLLQVLISSKKKDVKKLTLFAKGEGSRDLQASYVVETPVWKTSYRVLLGEEKPLIQGWALVDNTQEEDWENVALTLVAGLPISFVHDLYSPRYKRRPVVEVQEEEAYAPPILEAAMPAAAGAAEEFDLMEDVGLSHVASDQRLAKRSPRALRPKSVEIQTRTVEVGDLFQYEIRNPVTVRRNQSALVPILQESFEGERVSIYNQEIRDKNPMLAINFENTTGMTLEGGPVTVIEEESYVGEAMLDTLKPREERLLPYSVDLGCVVTIDHKSDLRRVHRVTIQNGVMRTRQHRIQKTIYVVENKSEEKRDLFLEHRFRAGWELIDTTDPVIQTDNFYRFRFDVPPREQIRFTVQERGDEQQIFSLQSVSRDQIGLWIESRTIDDKTATILSEVVALSDRSAELGREIAEGVEGIDEIAEDQERLRKNLKALGTSQDEKALRERYVTELGAAEDRLRELREGTAGLRDQQKEVDRDLRGRLVAIEVDRSL